MRLRAADLVSSGLQPNEKVAAWVGVAGGEAGSVKLEQAELAKQPMLRMISFANASQLRRCAELFVVGAAARGSCAASREGRRESPR